MPFKIWSVGEEVLASDFQTYVGNQVVAQFTDATQRDAQVPAPANGQMCTLGTYLGLVFIWNGDAWVEPTPFVQCGTEVVTTNGSGGTAITFPTPFLLPPFAVSLCDAGATSVEAFQCAALDGQILSTGIGFIIHHATGGGLISDTATISWIAYGARA